MICSPSFLSSNFDILQEEIMSVDKAKWLHFDVMDGQFVPNKTYDYHLLETVKAYSNQFFDCHLMIENPEEVYLDYIQAGADLVTFHYEACSDSKAFIKRIKKAGVKAGISIKPGTDVTVLDAILKDVDVVLIMSVEPGKGGQKFIGNSLQKIKYLSDKRTENNYDFLIEVDGGINFKTAGLVKEVGNDVVVVGSFIFNNKDRNHVIEAIENV